MKKNLLSLSLFGTLFISGSAFANLADELSNLVGYTIVDSKTISGWYAEGTKGKGEGFEGCDYDRVIVFSDNKTLKCAGYGYQYAYRPTAIILFDGLNFKMLVEDELYDMQR
jgi:hypothetical protein